MKKIVTFFIIAGLFSASNLHVFSQKIRNDKPIKTPVIKYEEPVSAKLQSAAAFSDGNGVYIHWQAEFETKNTGFYLYRVSPKGTELVSEAIIGGGSLVSSEDIVYGRKYSYFDPNGTLENSYYIESFSANSVRQIVGKVATQYLADIKTVAGKSNEQLRIETDKAKQYIVNNEVKLPKEMQSELEANLAPPDPVMQRWVASQAGVKIGVKQEGLYRVTRTELQTAGFDVNAAGNLWQLWVDGKQQAINVGVNDSYIEFYGNGMDTPESGTKFYFLLVGAQNGLRMATSSIRNLPGNVAAKSYNQYFQRKDRLIYIPSEVLNGDEENFFGTTVVAGSNPNPVNFTFNLTSVDFGVSKANFELTIQGINQLAHLVSVTLNGEPLGQLSWVGKIGKSGSFQIPTSFLREGTNTMQLQATASTGDQNVLNSLKVSYYRKYEAIQNKISFYTDNYRQTTVSGFASPNIRVFDLTDPDNPVILSGLTAQNNGGNYKVVLPANRGRAMFAAEDSGILTASSIAVNNPSTLSTPSHNGELIIVSYKDWLTQANDWANYRRGQGLSVEVVNIEDIFDEFSYGSISTAGMTAFFQYAKNNWQTAPNYILLLGDATYDFRGYENRPFDNFVPSKRVDTLYEETGSDEALSDFNNDGLAEIAIGRIPARNAANVTLVLNKVMTFESTIDNAMMRGATFAFDDPNGYNFEELSQDLAAQLPGNVPKSFIPRNPNGRSLLIPELNTGRYLLNYSGHGSLSGWESGFFTNADALAMTNSPNYTMFFMLTCLNGYFLAPSDSLGEAILKASNGGGVAVWASTGKTTPDVQRIMAVRFYSQLSASSMNKIGDLVKDAKSNLIGGRDVRMSWALLGDPTLKVK